MVLRRIWILACALALMLLIAFVSCADPADASATDNLDADENMPNDSEEEKGPEGTNDSEEEEDPEGTNDSDNVGSDETPSDSPEEPKRAYKGGELKSISSEAVTSAQIRSAAKRILDSIGFICQNVSDRQEEGKELALMVSKDGDGFDLSDKSLSISIRNGIFEDRYSLDGTSRLYLEKWSSGIDEGDLELRGKVLAEYEDGDVKSFTYMKDDEIVADCSSVKHELSKTFSKLTNVLDAISRSAGFDPDERNKYVCFAIESLDGSGYEQVLGDWSSVKKWISDNVPEDKRIIYLDDNGLTDHICKFTSEFVGSYCKSILMQWNCFDDSGDAIDDGGYRQTQEATYSFDNYHTTIAPKKMQGGEHDNIIAKSDVTMSDLIDGFRGVRNRETVIGDFCADAYRAVAGADIAFVNGGGIRSGINQGDLTTNDMIRIHPYGNMLCMVETTGQKILNALEHSVRAVEKNVNNGQVALGESGGFLQVSGIRFTVDTSIPTPVVVNEKGFFQGINGRRRASNVQVEKDGRWVNIDPNGKYKLACHDYLLQDMSDGYTMFVDDNYLLDNAMLDYQVLIIYINRFLGGTISSDDYGSVKNRINILPLH